MMKENLKRLALLVLSLSISPAANSQSYEASRHPAIQTASLKKARVDDRKDSSNGEYWFSRGYELHQSDRYPQAIEAFAHSIGLRYRQATAMYNIACGFAMLDDKDNALFWLERALASGFDRTDLLTNDSDLDPLRSDPRFRHILQKASFTKNEAKHSNGHDRLEEAISNFEQLRRESSRNGHAWFDLGYVLHYSSEHARAIEAFERAIQLGHRSPTSMYNIACANAMMGRRDAAFEWLEKSVQAGFEIGGYVWGDNDLDSLRSDPRFKRFLDMTSDHHKVKKRTKSRSL